MLRRSVLFLIAVLAVACGGVTQNAVPPPPAPLTPRMQGLQAKCQELVTSPTSGLYGKTVQACAQDLEGVFRRPFVFSAEALLYRLWDENCPLAEKTPSDKCNFVYDLIEHEFMGAKRVEHCEALARSPTPANLEERRLCVDAHTIHFSMIQQAYRHEEAFLHCLQIKHADTGTVEEWSACGHEAWWYRGGPEVQ